MARLRRGRVTFKGRTAGVVEETDTGYRFTYDPEFLKGGTPIAVSLPLQQAPFESDTLFPFFEGLLPEGWYAEIVCKALKIDDADRFGLLVGTCGDCVGADEKPE